jgi:CheY-like chemotaxis protein
LKDLKRILLVEDDPRDVELTLSALDEFNLANGVFVVNDGLEALNYLLHEGKYSSIDIGFPAVILLDIKLPKLSGLEVLKIIKSDQRLSNIPVVMLTSSDQEPDLKEAYSFGANAYVVKPVDFQDFIKAIKQLGLFWAMINKPPPGQYPK